MTIKTRYKIGDKAWFFHGGSLRNKEVLSISIEVPDTVLTNINYKMMSGSGDKGLSVMKESLLFDTKIEALNHKHDLVGLLPEIQKLADKDNKIKKAV
jgi:hypothetical protein